MKKKIEIKVKQIEIMKRQIIEGKEELNNRFSRLKAKNVDDFFKREEEMKKISICNYDDVIFFLRYIGSRENTIDDFEKQEK